MNGFAHGGATSESDRSRREAKRVRSVAVVVLLGNKWTILALLWLV